MKSKKAHFTSYLGTLQNYLPLTLALYRRSYTLAAYPILRLGSKVDTQL